MTEQIPKRGGGQLEVDLDSEADLAGQVALDWAVDALLMGEAEHDQNSQCPVAW